jgi:endonuclease/exonuclease/phosphatase family metal-dependent hydrolase
MTVRDGSGDATRRVAAYQVTQSWEEPEVTWNRRKSGYYWNSKGGDMGTQVAVQTVGNTAGARASWDVTALVKQAVAGQLGSSRYTRLALVDLDSPTKESWRGYYTPNDSSSYRPTLKVTYGGTTSTTTTSSTGTRLRVLHWNIQKNGWGTDGRYDPNRIVSWIAKINPDIISLNEVEAWNSYSYGEDGVALYKSLLTQKMGGTWYVWQAQDYGNWSDKGLRSVVYSRYPFSSTYRTTYSAGKLKAVGGVTVHVNGRLINFMTTHFDPYSYDYRMIQAKDLRYYAGGFSEDRIICGDFNEQAGNLDSITNYYHDAWAVAKSAGIAYSASDNPYGNTRNSRIDYVFYSRGERYLSLKKVQVVDTRDSNGEMPSDHRPVVAEFTVQ